MPPVMIALAALFSAIADATSVAFAIALFNTILAIGSSLVLGQIAKLFQKGPSASSLSSQLASRTITSRQAIAPWRVLYGQNRVGGIITALHTTGSNNEKLHIVITIAGHELNASSTMYFDGVAVPLDGSGNATGNFAGFVHAEFNPGTRSQAAFAGFLAAAPSIWTSAYRQRGRAGWYVQLTWDQTKFPNGVPNITFDVQGRKVYDPRNGTIAYSNNAALCIADYLNNASFGLVAQTKYPIAAAMLSTTGTVSNFSAANLLDGDVTTNGWSNNTSNAGSTVSIDLGSGNAQEFRRCRMYMTSSGQVQTYDVDYSDDGSTWTAAAAGFLPDVKGWNEVELAPNGAHRFWRILFNSTVTEAGFVSELEFYTSDVDSTQLISAANTCDEQVSLLAGGTQNRFMIDGSFDTSESPANVVGRMNSALAGSVLYVAGKWGIYPGIWRAPTISLSDADFRGPLVVQTRLTHRDLYNGVKGTFISPTNNWQAGDYPPFQDAAALQEDNNEALWLDVELPFTISGAMAQRISKIALRRARHQITVQGQFKLTAYQVQPLDVVQLSHPRFGWVNKTFEVTACTMLYEPDTGGAPRLGVDLTLREADSTIYDWSTADEVALNAPPVPTLPSNAVTQAPSGLILASAEIVRAQDGIKQTAILVTWTSPADQFVLAGGHIPVQYKKHTDSLWLTAAKADGAATQQLIPGVTDAILYDVQIWAENASGVKSAIVSGTVTPTATTSRSPSYTSYRPLTNPLTGHDAGSNDTVNIAAFTMRVAGLDVSLNSGSITALARGTLYYIYYDDPSLAGGAVTYVATTTKETALNGAGRFFAGSIQSPLAGASDTAGNNDGGAGAQAGGFAIYRATAFASVDGTNSPWTTPLNGNDANDGTFAKIVIGGAGGDSASMTWSGFVIPNLPYTSLILKMKTAVPANTQISGAASLKLSYDLGAGAGAVVVYNKLAGTTRALTTDAVSLTPSNAFNKMTVNLVAVSGATDTAGKTGEMDAYEVWVEGTW